MMARQTGKLNFSRPKRQTRLASWGS